IDKNIPPLLTRLNITGENWLTLSTQFEGRFARVIGTLQHLKQACAALHYRRTPGIANCKLLFEGA
ncbi:MAG: transposase, partial [Gammaproteobacteria bacterium]|nr:transposase [Gammaproteobacteria bacterium]MBQ0840958.1 transposase [Gammaproteobacteria bacterium]